MYKAKMRDGGEFGPVDLATLGKWVAENRLAPDSTIYETETGRSFVVRDHPFLRSCFPRGGETLSRKTTPTRKRATPPAALSIGLLVFCVLLSLITVPKLYVMGAIKGWLPGGRKYDAMVIDKFKEEPPKDSNLREPYYAFSWGAIVPEGGIQQGTSYVEPDEWKRIHRDQGITIVRVPGDSTWYYYNSIYVSPGNFVFDFVLLTLEGLGIAFAVRSLRRQ